ncbi:MAG: hypothetical protein KJO79_00495, partial [Verrucomicrobiae bacterium]|nr:hypothetical protein [Verrucomicrobiae bacterium]
VYFHGFLQQNMPQISGFCSCHIGGYSLTFSGDQLLSIVECAATSHSDLIERLNYPALTL